MEWGNLPLQLLVPQKNDEQILYVLLIRNISINPCNFTVSFCDLSGARARGYNRRFDSKHRTERAAGDAKTVWKYCPSMKSTNTIDHRRSQIVREEKEERSFFFDSVE